MQLLQPLQMILLPIKHKGIEIPSPEIPASTSQLLRIPLVATEDHLNPVLTAVTLRTGTLQSMAMQMGSSMLLALEDPLKQHSWSPMGCRPVLQARVPPFTADYRLIEVQKSLGQDRSTCFNILRTISSTTRYLTFLDHARVWPAHPQSDLDMIHKTSAFIGPKVCKMGVPIL